MKNKNTGITIIRIILIVLGVIFALYGMAVLALIGTGAWFNFIFLAGGIVLIAIGSLFKKLLTINKWVLRAICLVLVLCLCNFGIYEAKAIFVGRAGEALSASTDAFSGTAPKWIIVLGAKVLDDGSPKLEYAVRLVRAEELCTEKSNLILTGGKGLDEPISEAMCGYNYLSKRAKVSAKEILLEDKSTSTTENLKNSLEIIKSKGGSKDDSVLIISSSFHLFRASKIAARVGLTNTAYAGSTGLFILIPYYYVREYAAYVRECI